MAQGSMSQHEMQRDFMYLFERMGEPLGYGVKGSGDDMVYYNVPVGESGPVKTVTNDMMAQVRQTITVQMPSTMPMNELKEISTLCPRSGLFGYFIPSHRKALVNLRKILLDQNTTKDLFNMACFCRDSPMVNSQLFITAVASCLAIRKDTKKFIMPEVSEIMPEIFFSDRIMKQAEKMSRLPDGCKSIIRDEIKNITGHQNDPENRLWYFREDIGINSHHFHWHVVFPGDYGARNEMKRDRRGELFYYMHHSMIARYDTERLCNGLTRTRLFDFDNLVIEEGYFGKLYSSNSGHNWGTRQANTKLENLVGANDGTTFWDLKIEDLKRWRDRILDAIDTGVVIKKDGNKREVLTETTGIDILGDIVENSQDSPHDQYYGVFGFHNMGHLMIAYSHDPSGKYRENFGPMGDTSTAMRDPAFYRWHKYIDDMFDKYKQTLNPYELDMGTFPLVWSDITVNSISVKNSNSKYQGNTLSTHWMDSEIDLARGLDFYRTEMRNGGPVYARFRHLNYDRFKYEINVNNNSGRSRNATVRIFMAPRLDEHGERFRMAAQRLLFFEMDKFSHKLPEGSSTITRESLNSSVTLQTQNSFRELANLNRQIERDDFRTERDMSRCGCGWPQHLLLPMGTPAGAKFDLFVMITDGQKDTVPLTIGHTAKTTCREAFSFCGIMDENYPDARPMGYPFDRRPYMEGNNEVANLDEYVQPIPNAAFAQVIIFHEPTVIENGKYFSSGMGMISEKGEVVNNAKCNSQAQIRTQPKPPDNRGGKTIIPIPPNQGPPPRWQNQNTRGFQSPRGYNGYNRTGRQSEPNEDWDYLDNENEY